MNNLFKTFSRMAILLCVFWQNMNCNATVNQCDLYVTTIIGEEHKMAVLDAVQTLQSLGCQTDFLGCEEIEHPEKFTINYTEDDLPFISCERTRKDDSQGVLLLGKELVQNESVRVQYEDQAITLPTGNAKVSFNIISNQEPHFIKGNQTILIELLKDKAYMITPLNNQTVRELFSNKLIRVDFVETNKKLKKRRGGKK